MSVATAALATIIEFLPGIRRADVTGDGVDELVIGPHPESKRGRFFRHFGSITLGSVRGYAVVVGVR